MLDQLARNWWALALRGALALLFGICAFVIPGATLAAVVMVFGIYALIDGVFAVTAAVRAAERHQRWIPFFIEGLFGIAAGIIAFAWPGITALSLLYLVASWALLTGILEIAAAIRLRKEIANEWALALGGALSILLAVLLIAEPGAGLLAWVYIMGAYAILFGITLLALAFRLRGRAQHFSNHATV